MNQSQHYYGFRLTFQTVFLANANQANPRVAQNKDDDEIQFFFKK
jgi:hypothetical protein